MKEENVPAVLKMAVQNEYPMDFCYAFCVETLNKALFIF